jgi:alpha-tubulin suppressor-like RCC1 family protein
MAALALSACDSTAEGDGGVDGGAEPDAGPQTPDSGPSTPDAGPPRDAGPSCTEGCEFVELALGQDHTCARRANGEVWCWGGNQEGQLGDNRMRHDDCAPGGVGERIDCSAVPVQVRVGAAAFLQDATQIASDGGYGTCALRESGEVWCWGLEPIERERGGNRQRRFVAQRIEDFGGVTQVTGWEPTCLLRETGDVVCYGINGAGELGVGDQVEIRLPDATRPVMGLAGAVEVATWGHFGGVSCARTADAVYCWGSDREGQIGDGEPPVGEPVESCMTGGTPPMSFDCSKTASQVIGDADAPLADVAQLTVGSTHVCALRSGTEAGTVDCWGDNRAGQLAQPADITNHIRATQIADLFGVAEVDAGGRFTCARMTDGTIQCWGFNHNGQLGDGLEDHDTSSVDPVCNVPPSVVGDCSHAPVEVSEIDDAVELGAGGSHACVIRESGEIWCWGYNNTNQLGDGTRQTSYAPTRVLGLP